MTQHIYFNIMVLISFFSMGNYALLCIFVCLCPMRLVFLFFLCIIILLCDFCCSNLFVEMMTSSVVSSHFTQASGRCRSYTAAVRLSKGVHLSSTVTQWDPRTFSDTWLINSQTLRFCFTEIRFHIAFVGRFNRFPRGSSSHNGPLTSRLDLHIASAIKAPFCASASQRCGCSRLNHCTQRPLWWVKIFFYLLLNTRIVILQLFLLTISLHINCNLRPKAFFFNDFVPHT